MRSSCHRALLFFAIACVGCGSERNFEPRPVAIVSAFPAELVPLLQRAVVDEIIEIDGRKFRVGTIDAMPVILALSGIGLRNAENTTRTLLDNFEVKGIVVSAVAGSSHRIGDVVVPESWTFTAGASVPVDADWLNLARQLSAAGIAMQHCTERPSAPTREPVCLPHQPQLFVGGLGRSTDPFGELPFACQPGGGEVYGCDVEVEAAAPFRITRAAALEPVVDDMETAAIASVAAARGVKFIAFRGVSDGEGDPLHLPGFPAQFLTYYRLAARNAAAATLAFVSELE